MVGMFCYLVLKMGDVMPYIVCELLVIYVNCGSIRKNPLFFVETPITGNLFRYRAITMLVLEKWIGHWMTSEEGSLDGLCTGFDLSKSGE